MPTTAVHPDPQLEHAKDAIRGVVAFYKEVGRAALEAVAEGEVAQLRARVVELESELQSIADAKHTTWDGYNTPQDFVAWVQNRCRFLLKRN